MSLSPNSEPVPVLFPLPQYGFGHDIHFASLCKQNRFLYRVYTPKERAPFFDPDDPFFVAPKFDKVYARTPVEISKSPLFEPSEATYADVARHMEWTTRATSAYLSTSFSFAWSIWEASRRYHQGVKKDVEIAVIDAWAVSDRAATAVELLRKSSPNERNQQYKKWYNFSQDSQSVLVYGFIPCRAILSSIPLLAILERMPSYFLRTKGPMVLANPLQHVAWNYTDKKHHYRQFCQDMSNRFFAQAQELRYRDATGGSIRLALTLLRPWFHRMATEDFGRATSTLRDLAIIIANWGGQWWTKEHSELNRILDTMTITLGEELLQRFKRNDNEEVTRLHDTVDALERIIRIHETERLARPLSRGPAAEYEYDDHHHQCATTPITPECSPKMRAHRRTVSMSMSIDVPPRAPGTPHTPPFHQTPITPPDSPRKHWNLSGAGEGAAQPRQVLSNVAFQPLSTPLIWPSMRPRSRALSTASTSASLLSRPASPRPAPVYEGAAAAPSPRSGLGGGGASPEMIVAEEFQEFHSRAATSPSMSLASIAEDHALDSLQTEGFRARTLSDLSSGLRIVIPVASRPPMPPPSPSVSLRSIRSVQESVASSPRTLAPSSPPPLSFGKPKPKSPVLSPTLGSPFQLVSASELEKLPPLPASPTVSWGSASTLPSRAPSPSPSPRRGKDAPRTLTSKASTMTSSSSSYSVVQALLPSSTSSVSSIHRDAAAASLQAPISTSPSSLLRLLPPANLDQEPVHAPPPLPLITRHLSNPPSSREKGPEPEPIVYLPPRRGISLLSAPIVQPQLGDGHGVDDDDEGRRRPAAKNGRSGPALVETASFIVTGFLVGAFVTLFLMSTQRRTLLYLT